MNTRLQGSVTVRGSEVGALVVSISGEFDAVLSPRVLAVLVDAAGRNAVQTVHVDLSSVTFMDSSGIRALLQGQQAVAARGGTIRVVQASATVRRLLELTGLEEQLNLAVSEGVPAVDGAAQSADGTRTGIDS